MKYRKTINSTPTTHEYIHNKEREGEREKDNHDAKKTTLKTHLHQ
jgi:hypothetical protein